MTAPPRTRGSIALLEDNCTSCMLCARECPDWCIEIDSHSEVVPPQSERGRPRTVHVLDRFTIDFGLCLWCGICIDVCPFEALFWSPEPVTSTDSAVELRKQRGDLAAWLDTVPDRGLNGEHDPDAAR